MPRKTGKEARTERVTWFAMVMLFVPLNFGQWLQMIPAYFFPAAVGIILITSGVYQYNKGWRVAPIVWIIAALMIAYAGYAWYMRPLIDPILIALLGVICVILLGILTNES
jgi:hypothetical protein